LRREGKYTETRSGVIEVSDESSREIEEDPREKNSNNTERWKHTQ